jgi:hypothetical protein
VDLFLGVLLIRTSSFRTQSLLGACFDRKGNIFHQDRILSTHKMVSQPSHTDDSAQDTTSNASSSNREDKIDKGPQVAGLEEGSTDAISADDQLLATLGYRAELKREFSYLTVFGQSFGAMGIAPAIAESIIFSLGSAGAPGMVWTYLVDVYP